MNRNILMAASLIAVSFSAGAEVYKCQSNGKTVFQDKPCAGDGLVMIGAGNYILEKDYKAPITPGEKLLIEQKEKAEYEKKMSEQYRKEAEKREAKEKALAEARAKETKWSEFLKKNIKRDEVVLGMSRSDLLWSIGEPRKINESVGAWGKHEQLIYDYRNSNIKYVYVENDKVVSWQTDN